MSVVLELTQKKLATPPKWLPHNVHYETLMGSVAYGVSSETSDCDVYGFCFPMKDEVFPHLRGEIMGFGRQKKRFEQYQQHHIEDKNARKSYDITIYSIVKFFSLCMDNNPNMVDALFTPQNCVLSVTRIGQMVRERRDIFLHKGCWHKFKGYAYSQLHKMRSKNPEGKRKELVEKYGFDVKFAYHVVRLMDEVEQILETGTLNLQRAREQLKEIRRGEWTEERIHALFERKEAQLEELYHKSSLPHGPREAEIKRLLLECLEEHYGDLSSCVVDQDKAVEALRAIKDMAEKGLR
jgi:predicted nucleotidyltransferase